jgi:Rab GDP dissociation inhibitor
MQAALVKTDVTKYLEFKAVEGAYVLGKGGAIYKVPATDGEALKSPLMGLFEKRRARAFFLYVQDYEVDDPKTHKGHDLDRLTMSELYAAFGLEANTIGASVYPALVPLFCVMGMYVELGNKPSDV